jgi:superfamily I DNA/RNA helicase
LPLKTARNHGGALERTPRLRFSVSPSANLFVERFRDAVVAAERIRELIESEQLPTRINPVGPDRVDFADAVMSIATTAIVETGLGCLLATGGLRAVWLDDVPSYEIGDLPGSTRTLATLLDNTAASEREVEVAAAPDLREIVRAVLRSIRPSEYAIADVRPAIEPANDSIALIGLDDQQRSAVQARADAYLLINAAAGSGKTHTLAYRIAHLIEDCGVPAERCVVLTFSVAARRQIQDRLALLAARGHPHLSNIEARTLHSLAYRILTLAATFRRTRFRPGFSVVKEITDRTDRGATVRAAAPFIEQYDQLFAGLDDSLSRSERIGLYSGAINGLRNGHRSLGVVSTPDQLSDTADVTVLSARNGQLRQLDARNVSTVWTRYDTLLAQNNEIDLGGLPCEALNAIRRHPALASLIVSNWAMAFVDEYQDTSLAQDEMLMIFAQSGMLLNAVGDGDQTITSFAGARAKNILEFTQHIRARTGRLAEVRDLETNYRSRPEIVSLAASVIQNNSGRLPKTMRPADSSSPEVGHVVRVEGDLRHVAPWVALKINALLSTGIDPGEIAILYRKEAEHSPQKSSVLEHLRSQGIAVSEDEEESPALRVLTIHRSKGLEFDHVFVLFLGPRDFPDPRGDPEEERRLLYVAATRARKTLYVCGRPGASPDLFKETDVSDAMPTHEAVRTLTGVLSAADLKELQQEHDATLLDDWDLPA